MARETVIASFIMRIVKPAAAAATAGAGTAAGAELPACSAAGGSDSHSGAGVAAGGSGPKTGARIAVRHVQSGYERRFVNLDDAMDFIREEIRLLEQD